MPFGYNRGPYISAESFSRATEVCGRRTSVSPTGRQNGRHIDGGLFLVCRITAVTPPKRRFGRSPVTVSPAVLAKSTYTHESEPMTTNISAGRESRIRQAEAGHGSSDALG